MTGYTAMAVVAILFTIGFFLFKKGRTFRYFSADCRIYETSGKLLFSSDAQLCAFSDDGKLLKSHTGINSFSFVDEKDVIIWSSYEHIHHDLKFTTDQKAILLISAEMIDFEDEAVKSDCFSKRDLNNKIISQWCFGENLQNLAGLGFTISKMTRTGPDSLNKLISAKSEISHANSINEIQQNALSDRIPAFQKGNYLVNLYAPIHALLILDNEMKNILWSKKLEIKLGDANVMFETHDDQVMADGKILMYVNKYIYLGDPKLSADWYSSLRLYDPVTESFEVVYQATPKSEFKSKIFGSVARLENGNYFFSDLTQVGKVREVSSNGKILWTFDLPDKKIIQKAKPIYNSSFLRNRGIADDEENSL